MEINNKNIIVYYLTIQLFNNLTMTPLPVKVIIGHLTGGILCLLKN